MDINDFKTFLEVNRTRHFGHAAANLCVTQSTVSARIRQLEEQLGAKLFVRERNNIQLTLAGEKLLDYAELIVTAWGRARQDIGPEGGRQTLIVGGVPSLWDIILQAWLQQIYSEHEDLLIHAEVRQADTLIKRVLNGTMDVAFVFDSVSHDQLNIQPIHAIELVLVSSVSQQDLNNALSTNYVLVDWGSSFLTQHTRQFADIVIPILHIGLGRIALDFILANGGSAYLARPMVDEYLSDKKLFLVENAPVFQREGYAIINKNNDGQELINKLITSVLV